jgi:tetratricopeptide (TPR) repeat protein
VAASFHSSAENYVRALDPDPQRRTDLLLEAVRLQPEYAAAMYQLGRAYHLDRNFNASNQAMERIRTGDREYVQAQFLRGLNHYYLGDFAAAVKVFISLTPTYDVLINLGASLASQGDGVGALLAWKRASDEDPLGSDSVFNVGYWSFTKGDMETAVRSFEQFMKLEGRDGEALFLLGRAYAGCSAGESQRLLALATRLLRSARAN